MSRWLVITDRTGHGSVMSARKNISMSPSPELPAATERLLAAGRYDSAGEVVRHGLRLLDERKQSFQGHHDAGAAIVVETTAQEPLPT